MKKIIVILLTILLIFLIYHSLKRNDTILMTLGDFKITRLNNNNINTYNNKFVNNDYKINTLLSDIYNNNKGIKKELQTTNLLIVSIGTTDLINIINNNNNSLTIYKKIDELLTNYDILLNQIRCYYKRKIIVIGIYDSKIDINYQKYFNKNLQYLIKYELYLNFNNYNNITKTKEEIVLSYLNTY